MVAVNGWEEVSSVSALDLAKKMEELQELERKQ